MFFFLKLVLVWIHCWPVKEKERLTDLTEICELAVSQLANYSTDGQVVFGLSVFFFIQPTDLVEIILWSHKNAVFYLLLKHIISTYPMTWCFLPRRWVTKSLHPSVSPPLSNFSTHCGPQVRKFANPSPGLFLPWQSSQAAGWASEWRSSGSLVARMSSWRRSEDMSSVSETHTHRHSNTQLNSHNPAASAARSPTWLVRWTSAPFFSRYSTTFTLPRRQAAMRGVSPLFFSCTFSWDASVIRRWYSWWTFPSYANWHAGWGVGGREEDQWKEKWIELEKYAT